MGSSAPRRRHARHRAPARVVLHGGCPLCRGDLSGTAGHRYVCSACSISFGENHLIRTGKLMRRRRGASTEEYYSAAHPR